MILLLIFVALIMVWPIILLTTRGRNEEIAEEIKKSDNRSVLIYFLAIAALVIGIIISANGMIIHPSSGNTVIAQTAVTTPENYGTEATTTEEVEINDPYEVINGIIYADIPSAVYTCEFDGDEKNYSFVVRNDNNLDKVSSSSLDNIYQAGVSGFSVSTTGRVGVRLDNIKAYTKGDYTISFWYKPNTDISDWTPIYHAAHEIEDYNKSIRVRIISKDSVAPIVSSEIVSSGVSKDINAQIGQQDLVGRWNHIVLAVNSSISGEYDGTVNARIYVNGQKMADGDVAVMDLEDSLVTLGISVYDNPINAEYDSFKLFDYMLSDDQIYELYRAY